MTELEQILASGQPYFGAAFQANQGSAYFPYLKNIVKSIPRRPLTILEIGSWAGNSLNAWNDASDKTANFIVIDTWAEYISDAVMTHAARTGDIEKLFWHNMKTIGVTDRMLVYKGTSHEILPTLPDNSVDIVFIDRWHWVSSRNYNGSE